jgi:hypothetical protein
MVPLSVMSLTVAAGTAIGAKAWSTAPTCGGALQRALAELITGRGSVKLKNALRTGRATLCVQRSRGNDLRYVTAEGSVRVEPCSIEERRDLWAHYTDEAKADAMAAGDLSGLCVLVLAPQRWTAISE